MFFMRCESIIPSAVIIIPQIWTAWVTEYVCICVHQENLSNAAGLESGTPGLRVDQATNESAWRHIFESLIWHASSPK